MNNKRDFIDELLAELDGCTQDELQEVWELWEKELNAHSVSEPIISFCRRVMDVQQLIAGEVEE